MHFSMVSIIKAGVSLTIIVLCGMLYAEIGNEEKLKLNIGFDLTQGTNGVPSLRIRNFEGLNTKRNVKRSLRDDSSSESEEKGHKKDEEEKKLNVRDIRESQLSEEGDSSDSDGDRGISTKGVPYKFEAEDNPNIHERYSKDSESE